MKYILANFLINLNLSRKLSIIIPINKFKSATENTFMATSNTNDSHLRENAWLIGVKAQI